MRTKILALSVCLLLFPFMGRAQQVKDNITLDFKNAAFSEVISSVERQSGYTFFYDAKQIDKSQKITVSAHNAPLVHALDSITRQLDLDYEISAKQILLYRKSQRHDTPSTISGRVLDVNQTPVIGAAVLISGTTTGVITDIDGKFEIEIPDNAPEANLEFTSMGYITKKMTLATGSKAVNVYLSEDAVLLEASVAVGYGTQKKVNLTGAVSNLEGDKLADRSAVSVAHMLQGNVPGLNVTTGSGRPGNNASINIRGVNSINGGNPLVLIDGVEGEMNTVNPSDIESISVIKDASSSSIYGARASFGVILITTKQGTESDGKARVSYSGRFGWTEPTTSTDFETRGYYSVYVNDLFFNAYNGTNYTTYTKEDMDELWARRNDVVENPERPWVVIDQRDGRDTYHYYANTDWYHHLFNDVKPTQNHNISFSGGAKRFKYFFSAGYYDEVGVFRQNPDKFQKANMRSKINFDVTKWLSISNNTSYFRSTYHYPGFSNVNSSFSNASVGALASYPTQNPDGTSIFETTASHNSTVMDGLLIALDKGKNVNSDSQDQLQTTTEMIIKPVKGLDIVGNFTYRLLTKNNVNRSTNGTYSTYPGVIEKIDTKNFEDKLSEMNTRHDYLQANVFATYSHSFAESHNLKVMAGFNWETLRIKDVRATGFYLMTENLNDLNLIGQGENGEKRMEVSGGKNSYEIAGAFARINYDYKGRYLFELSGRFDGTSRFAKANRWGFFPSASLGWRISEEEFFKPVKDWFNNLKIRYSYGSLGNQQVGYYDYIREIKLRSQDYLFGGSTKPISATIGAPVASDLTWEVAQHQNVGLDMAFLGNRLGFTGEFYIRDTKDMLTAGIALPGVYGASSPKMNSADLRTMGYELSLNWKDMFNLAGKPFSYNIGFIFSDSQTTITKFDNPTKSFAKKYYEGMKWGEIWGYTTDGLFASDAEAKSYPVDQSSVNQYHKDGLLAGDLKYVDLDGDNKISYGKNTADDSGDLRIIGNKEPRYNYGINLGFNWLGIDFSILFQGIGHIDWYPPANAMMFWGPYARPYTTFMPRDFHKMYWTEDNPDAYFPRPRGYVALGSNRELSTVNDRYLQNIGYCRLKNLTIGYSLPKKWMDKVHMQGVRIYFSGENLATMSGIMSDYIDPEMAMTGGNLRIYPWQKTFTFGIDIKF